MTTMTPFCGIALSLTLCLAGCQPSPGASEGSGEPKVQLTMGTQTGGSTEQLACRSEQWEVVSEESPLGSSYVGALQLQGWRLDCEKTCIEAPCLTNCARDCSLTDAPEGSARNAGLRLTSSGPVERRVPVEDELAECQAERRTTVAWELSVDGGFIAQGTNGLSFSTDGSGELGLEPTSFEPEGDVVAPTPQDFQALGSSHGNDAGRVFVGGMASFAGVEAGLELSFYCSDCSDRVAIPLAAGVLHREGRPHEPPTEPETAPESWHYWQDECALPFAGTGGAPNAPGWGGVAGSP